MFYFFSFCVVSRTSILKQTMLHPEPLSSKTPCSCPPCDVFLHSLPPMPKTKNKTSAKSQPISLVLINIFSLRHGFMGAKWLIATALVAHRVYHVQQRANGKQKDETADEDGKHDEQDDGPSEASLGPSAVLLLPACGLIHLVELVVACGTCFSQVSSCFTWLERLCRGQNLHE